MAQYRGNYFLRISAWLLPCVAVIAALSFAYFRGDSEEAEQQQISDAKDLNSANGGEVSQTLQTQSASPQVQQTEAINLNSDAVAETVFPVSLVSVLGYDGNILDVSTRLSLLEVKDRLSEAEFEAIYTYLGQDENRSGLDDGHWLWLKNDLMTLMRDRDANRNRYFAQLENLFVNNGDSVVRNYALQHLTVLALGGEFEESVRGILKQGASVKEGTIAGTALLGYSRLVEESGNDFEWIRSASHKVASENDYESASRASAMQVLAKIDRNAADAIAQEIVVEASVPSMERISAVAVLGRSKENFSTLKVLASDTDPRVRRAARSAISKLQTQ